MVSDTTLGPDPATGWSREIVVVRDALVMPPTLSAMVQPCGVAGPDGWVGHAATWRGRRPMMVPPDTLPRPSARLEGRHLWCGQLWAHFGHFLCESMARIWALADTDRIDGLIFIAKRPGRVEKLKGWQADYLALLGIDLPVTVLAEPTEVAELVVPGQAFGLGPIDRATPEYRAFFHDRFCKDVVAAGPKKLYLSRSALGGLEGSVILEEMLEANLVAAGYEVFHPQKHSIAEQVAHYRAATHVLGLDGSAFHMFGFVARADQKAAVILRRNSSVPNGLVHQIEAFTGRRPDVVAHVVADWVPQHKERAGRYSFGQLDFAAVAAELQDLGYIDNAADWKIPRFREVRKAIEDFGASKKLEFIRKLRKARTPKDPVTTEPHEGSQIDAA